MLTGTSKDAKKFLLRVLFFPGKLARRSVPALFIFFPWLKSMNTWRLQLKRRNSISVARKRNGGRRHETQGGVVSVIIPTLSKGAQADHFPKLRDLLAEYLPSQTYSKYEAIVCCDGSNERVEELSASLDDRRVKVYGTQETLGYWGWPQTRRGVEAAEGDFFVRMNDDNRPYQYYLETLVNGFEEGVGLVYGRVVFKGEARRAHKKAMLTSFVIPRDRRGTLERGNVDAMNFMVRVELAKKYVNNFTDDFLGDWHFIDSLLKAGVRAKFIGTIVGDKL